MGYTAFSKTGLDVIKFLVKTKVAYENVGYDVRLPPLVIAKATHHHPENIRKMIQILVEYEYVIKDNSSVLYYVTDESVNKYYQDMKNYQRFGENQYGKFIVTVKHLQKVKCLN